MSNPTNSEFLNAVRSEFKQSQIQHYSQLKNGDVIICINSPAICPAKLISCTISVVKHYKPLVLVEVAKTYIFSKQLYYAN